MVEWREWLKTTLDAGVTLVDADLIRPAGSFDSVPASKPFIEVRTGSRQRGPFPGVASNFAHVWVHDEAGTYTTIDAVIEEVKAALSGSEREAAVSESDGVSCRWLGDSEELADDGYGTICKYSSFQLNGKEQ